MIDMKRPEPAYPPPEGHVHVAVEDPGWRLESGRPCRFTVEQYRTCKAPSVAALNRKRGGPRGRDSWWAYCSEHMYGRWIEDGQVMWWVVRPEVES